MMPPQPKKSRKTFPKWTPVNACRKYHTDRTYSGKPLLQAAEPILPCGAGSPSITKERCTLGPPHPTSTFTPTATFVSLAVPGTSQGEEDRAGTTTKGNWL